MNRAKVVGALVVVVLLLTVLNDINQTKLVEYDNCISHTTAMKRIGIQQMVDTGNIPKLNLSTYNYSTAVDECSPYRPWW